ncbi:MAG: SusC/RagA family TonB-linked outer membrane protein, partial [Rikenellaceae bacterium]
MKDTPTGAISDAEGKFTFIALQNDILEITYVGKKPVIYSKLSPSMKEIIITMEDDAMDVEDVVVTGYQNVGRRDMVGSFTQIKADDIKIAGASSITDMLQGQVAGMIVTNQSSRVGSTSKIKIRGTTTLGNSDPIFVVDGIIQPDPIKMNASTGLIDDMKNIIGDQVSWLNPDDINTITVLKDASATAIYGSRASNGVIVITTKKPKFGDKLSITYSGTLTVAPRPNYNQFNYMNSQERIIFLKRKTQLEGMNTDWFDLLTRTAVSHNHNFSVSGASAKSTYRVSAGYNRQNGNEKGNKKDRFTANSNIDFQLHEKVKLSFGLNATIDKTTGYSGQVNPLKYATETSRAIPALEEDGIYAYYNVRNDYQYNNQTPYLKFNILNELENSTSNVGNGRISANINFNWKVIESLTYELTAGYNYSQSDRDSYVSEKTLLIAQKYRGYDYNSIDPTSPWYKAALLPHGGEKFTSNANNQSYNIQNKLIFQKEFNSNNRLNVMLGVEVSSSANKNAQNTVYGFAKDRGNILVSPTTPQQFTPLTNSLNGFLVLNNLYTGRVAFEEYTNNFVSLFATAAYTFKSRYVINANVRNDMSNRFGQDTNNRFDPTFSVGAAWRLSDEPWMESVNNVFSNINLKVTYGVQGNANLTTSPDLILKQQGL